MNSPDAKKKNSDYSQLIVIILSAIIAYAFVDPNPGGEFDVDLLMNILVPSVITVAILLFLTYHAQKYIAKTLGGYISYAYWPWGIFASIIVTILSVGAIPFYMPGIFVYDKHHGGLGRRLPEASRVESAAIAGVGVSLGLLVGLLFINSEYVSMAAIAFAIWNMLPIPQTNGFHFFNWHPIHGLFTAVLGLVMLFSYVYPETPILAFPIIIAIVFIPYQWAYIYVLARRTGISN